MGGETGTLTAFESPESFETLIGHTLPDRARDVGGILLPGELRRAGIDRSTPVAPILHRVGERLCAAGKGLMIGAPPLSRFEWQALAAAYDLYLAGIPAMRERTFGSLRARSVRGRADRPKGVAGEKQVTLDVPLGEGDRRFDRDPIAAQRLCREQHGDIILELFPQPFSFCEKHLLLHARRTSNDPTNQYLAPELHVRVWSALCAARVPGLRAAYNSIEAGASMNSRHWHIFTESLPIDIPGKWTFDGGTETYPLEVLVSDGDIDGSAAWLEQCNRSQQPYNIIYSPERNRIYHVARRPMSQIHWADWTSGFA